jgi:hypothetical protein
MLIMFFSHLCNSYYMGLKPRIMLADLDILKEVLMKDINIFTNRPVCIKVINVMQFFKLSLFPYLGCPTRYANTSFFER